MNKAILLLQGILFSVGMACCQEIKTGDLLPPLSIHYRISDQVFSGHTGEFKGKLLLIDFWNTSCIDCIRGFPKMLAIQQAYPGKVQVLLVTTNSQRNVDSLMRKLSSRTVSGDYARAAQQLPSVTGDSVLSRLFWHSGVPAHVWIDADQKLIGVAYSKSMTNRNIEAALAGRPVELMRIKEPDINFTNPLTWTTSKNLQSPGKWYYSVLCGRIEIGSLGSFRFEIRDSASDALSGYALLNHTPMELYAEAYSSWRKKIAPGYSGIPLDRMLIFSANKPELILSSGMVAGTWNYNHAYCYGINIPIPSIARIESTMRRDLDLYFDVLSRIETTRVKCYILKRNNKWTGLLARNKEEIRNIHTTGNTTTLTYQNTVTGLTGEIKNLLSIQRSGIPLVDETRYKGIIKVEVPWNEEPGKIDINTVFDSLKKQGLQIVVEYRNREMLVFRDNKKAGE